MTLPVLAMGSFEPSGIIEMTVYLILKAAVAVALWLEAIMWLRHPFRGELATLTAGIRRRLDAKHRDHAPARGLLLSRPAARIA